MKTSKEIRLKDGTTIAKGLNVTFTEESNRVCLVEAPGHPEPLRIRITSAFKVPGMDTLERWGNMGKCKTPSGQWTECDGHGPDGAPSWMLVLSLI
jgi:hypothetical protein